MFLDTTDTPDTHRCLCTQIPRYHRYPPNTRYQMLMYPPRLGPTRLGRCCCCARSSGGPSLGMCTGRNWKGHCSNDIYLQIKINLRNMKNLPDKYDKSTWEIWHINYLRNMTASIRLKFCSLLWTLKANTPHSWFHHNIVFDFCLRGCVGYLGGCLVYALGDIWMMDMVMMMIINLKEKTRRAHVVEDEWVGNCHHKNWNSCIWSLVMNHHWWWW